MAQSDYEKMYIGPVFNLQIREAQLMSLVFLTMTFGAGMPLVYFIAVVTVFVSFWVDLYLLINFYSLTNQFTKHLSASTVGVLPWAVIVHLLFAFFFYS